MSQNENGVVDLVGAGVPADQGLSALGLLMQLGGSVMAAYAGLLGFMLLFAGGGGGDLTIWAMLILALCVTRSMFHRAAGTELLYGRQTLQNPDAPMNPLYGVKRYIAVALVQSFVLAGVFKIKFEIPGVVAVAIIAALSVWPVTLAIIMSLPRFKRFVDKIPQGEDKGFEGASILMATLGASGACLTGTVLTVMVKAMPGRALQQGPVVLLLIMLGVLLIRSIIHVQAGVAGLRETSIDKSVDLANRYANFGVVSSFCAAGAMLLIAMSTHFDVSGLALVSGLCWMLMSWPLIIRRFYSERQFSDLLAGDDAPIHRRAPDAGLTGLGWLLIAQAALGATFAIPSLILGGGGGGGHHHGGDWGEILSAFGSLGGRSIWFSVGLVVLQLWAGFELIRMSPQHRAIANVYAVIAGVVTIYMMMPIVDMFKDMGALMDGGAASGMMFGPLAMQLVVPIATLILVNRSTSPTARARFRSRAPAPSAEPIAAPAQDPSPDQTPSA